MQYETQSSTINIEALGWIAVVIVALALRLPNLGLAPLSSPEAHNAMLAWQAVNGQGPSQVVSVASDSSGAAHSPLLFTANALLFTLCGASDALARFWPALAGVALALAPLLLRQRLGRVGALMAGLCLALSPTALIASRRASGVALAAAGGVACLGGLIRFFDTMKRSWLTLAAVGLALSLISDPLAYGLLISLALAWLLTRYVTHDTQYAIHSTYLSLFTPHFLIAFGAAALALSTGLGWHPSGLVSVGSVLADWIGRFTSASSQAVSPLILLVAYEPLLLVFGLGGLIGVLRSGSLRRERFPVLLAFWAVIGFLLLLLMPNRAPLDLLGTVIPLAMLTGVAAESLTKAFSEPTVRPAWSSGWSVVETAYAFIVLVLWAHLYLTLARYATLSDAASLALAALSLFLQAILFFGFSFTISIASAWRGMVIGTGTTLLALTLSVGWGAAHVRPSDPRELLAAQPIDVGVYDLVQTLRELSWRETGLPENLSFTFEAAPNSVLAWYLRDFSAARRVDRLSALNLSSEEDLPIVVSAGREATFSGDAEYTGQDFVLSRHWNPRDIVHNPGQAVQRYGAIVKWFLFRESPALPKPDQWATLWIRGDWAEQ